MDGEVEMRREQRSSGARLYTHLPLLSKSPVYQRESLLKMVLIVGVQASPARASEACTPAAISFYQYLTVDLGRQLSGNDKLFQ